jgi:hypothetical protein
MSYENEKQELAKKVVKDIKVSINISPENEKYLKVYLTFNGKNASKKEYQIFAQEAFNSYLKDKMSEIIDKLKEQNNK